MDFLERLYFDSAIGRFVADLPEAELKYKIKLLLPIDDIRKCDYNGPKQGHTDPMIKKH